jgi:hypothetical protein
LFGVRSLTTTLLTERDVVSRHVVIFDRPSVVAGIEFPGRRAPESMWPLARPRRPRLYPTTRRRHLPKRYRAIEASVPTESSADATHARAAP